MINKVGRDIPDEILERYGKEGYNGPDYRNGTYYVKAAPRVRSRMEGSGKILPSLQEALLKCGVRDGMVLSFHHHFRDGDYVVNLVMETVAALGIKDITICASSLGAAHDP